jgi:hypothetical protein
VTRRERGIRQGQEKPQGETVTRRRRDLQRIPGAGHYRLTLINGATVFTASTPSSQGGVHRLRADVRRALNQERGK